MLRKGSNALFIYALKIFLARYEILIDFVYSFLERGIKKRI